MEENTQSIAEEIVATTTLLAPPDTLRSIASTLRKKSLPYIIKKVDFINFNSMWKGYRGLGLEVTVDDYRKLFV